MRYRINDYAVRYDSTDIALKLALYFDVPFDATTIDDTVTRRIRESLRLVVDETVGGTILTSTGAKDNILEIGKGTVEGKDVYVMFSLLNLIYASRVDGDEDEVAALQAVSATDEFTIEVDFGGDVDLTDIAKQGENQEATNSAILSALNSVATSMYKGVPIVSQTGDATIAPNVLNVWGEVTSLNITKGNDIEGITNLYLIRFVAGEALQVSFTGFDLLWYGGSVPTWNAGSTYEINIIDNLALWAEFIPA